MRLLLRFLLLLGAGPPAPVLRQQGNWQSLAPPLRLEPLLHCGALINPRRCARDRMASPHLFPLAQLTNQKQLAVFLRELSRGWPDFLGRQQPTLHSIQHERKTASPIAYRKRFAPAQRALRSSRSSSPPKARVTALENTILINVFASRAASMACCMRLLYQCRLIRLEEFSSRP